MSIESEIDQVKASISALSQAIIIEDDISKIGQITAEIIELKARLKLLLNLLAKNNSQPSVDNSQAGSSRKRPNGSSPPKSSNYDLTVKRTLAEHGFLKDLQQVEENSLNLDDIFVNGDPLSNYLKLADSRAKNSETRSTLIFETTAIISNISDASDPELVLHAVIDYILQIAFQNKKSPPSKFNVQFYGPDMQSVFFIPMRPPSQNTVESIVAQFTKLSTSDTLSSIFNKRLGLKVCAWWSAGGGVCSHKQCPHVVPCGKSNNFFCLARALLYGKAVLSMNYSDAQFFICNSLEDETLVLMSKSGLDLSKQLYDIEDGKILINLIGSDFRMVIFDDMRNPIYTGPPNKYTICLSLMDQHFDYIPKINLFQGASEYCTFCCKKATRVSHFKDCSHFCNRCFRYGYKVCEVTDKQFCESCNLFFNNNECMELHRFTNNGKRQSLCEKRFYCKSCQRIIEKRSGKPHECTEEYKEVDLYCENCDIVHTDELPYCYLTPETPVVPSLLRYFFYDIETFTVDGKHIANVVCLTTYCSVCQDQAIDVNAPLSEAPSNCCCGTGNTRKYVFTSFDGVAAIEKFVDFILKRSDKTDKVNTIMLALNAGKFDTHLVLEELYKRPCKLDIIAQGFKIFCIKVSMPKKATIYLKDAVTFFMSSLRALPKTYGFEEDATKLYFPYAYSKPENLDIVLDHLPDLKYYEPDEMKSDEREKFLHWYNQNYQTRFCLKEALIIYCNADVEVLRIACVKFRRIMIDLVQLDPFFVATTIAKLAYVIFRSKFLKKHMIVNVGEDGYRKGEKQSEAAIKFFRLYEHQHHVKIQDATCVAGEYKIPDTKWKVDGVIRNANGEIVKVLEFLGCYYHGCLLCFSDEDQKLVGGQTAQSLYRKTMDRIAEIRRRYPVEYFWECEVNEKLKADKELKKFYDSIPIAPRLELRKYVLKGGRVENLSFYYKVADSEEIRYVDIVSLYPYVMKKSYPLGNPQVLTSESITGLPWTTAEACPYRGFILCFFIPNPHLKLPVLGYKSKSGNFVFGSCSKCADELQKVCDHEDSQRGWIGGFTDVELKAALARGCRVEKVFEVWNYSRWSGENGEPHLFHDYINLFQKLKIEASGWPCDDPIEKTQFISEYLEREGIELNPEAIEYNSGQRAITKLLNNSLWGKLAQRSEFSEIRITKSAQEFNKVMNDNTVNVIDFVHLNPTTDRIVIKKKKEFCSEPPTTALPIACFVTSYARLHLLSYLERVEGEICYLDTDSVCYVLREGETPIPEGKFLGEMEREKANKRIHRFISAGPKNYGLLMENENGEMEAELKIRSLPLTYSAAKLVNFEAIEKRILDKFGENKAIEPIAIPYTIFKRNKYSEIKNVHVTKNWNAVFKKGVVQDLRSIPFGYKPKQD